MEMFQKGEKSYKVILKLFIIKSEQFSEILNATFKKIIKNKIVS